MNIRIDTTEEARLRAILQTKNDPESLRLKRYLDMPDLSRTASSPIAELAERIPFVGGSAILMDVETGEIHALVSYPEYDPLSGNSRMP